MNLLERKAFKRLSQVLAPLMSTGESVLEFAIGANELGSQIYVAATTSAVFVLDPHQRFRPLRISYAELHSVLWDGHDVQPRGPLTLVFVDGRRSTIQMLGRGGLLAPVIATNVASNTIVHRHVVRDQHTGATFMYRRTGEHGERSWIVVADSGTRLDDDSTAHWAHETLRELNARDVEPYTGRAVLEGIDLNELELFRGYAQLESDGCILSPSRLGPDTVGTSWCSLRWDVISGYKIDDEPGGRLFESHPDAFDDNSGTWFTFTVEGVWLRSANDVIRIPGGSRLICQSHNAALWQRVLDDAGVRMAQHP